MKKNEHREQTMSTHFLVITAMFAALTLLATSVLKIQTPTFGYIHIGDCFVLLSGIFLGPVYGGLAAGIGSALSDLLGGYAMWVPGTFAIKFVDAMIAALVYRAIQKASKKQFHRVPAAVISGIFGEVFMVFGYFLFNVLILMITGNGFSAAALASAVSTSVAEIPFNIVQGAVGIVLAAVLDPIFSKIFVTTHALQLEG